MIKKKKKLSVGSENSLSKALHLDLKSCVKMTRMPQVLQQEWGVPSTLISNSKVSANLLF